MKKVIVLTLFCIVGYFLSIIENKEIESYAIVSGMGIDYNAENEEYEVTFEIYTLAGDSATDTKNSIVSTTGKNLTNAIDEFFYFYPKEPYLNHCGLIIIGEELAKYSIEDTMNYLNHNPSVRSAVYVMIAKESTAKEILNTKNDIYPIISSSIIEQLINNDNYASVWTFSKFHHICNILANEDTSVIIPVVYNKDNNLYINSAGIFDGFKLYTYINDLELFTLQIAWKHVTHGKISFEKFAFEINKVACDFYFKDDNTITLNIMLKVSFYDYSTEYNVETTDGLEAIKKDCENRVNKLFNDSIYKFKNENKIDPYGFIYLMYRTKPLLYKKKKDNIEETLVNLKVECNTTIIVTSSGYTQGQV